MQSRGAAFRPKRLFGSVALLATKLPLSRGSDTPARCALRRGEGGSDKRNQLLGFRNGRPGALHPDILA